MVFRKVLVTFLCALMAVAIGYAALTYRDLQRARGQAQAAWNQLAAARAQLDQAQAKVTEVRGELDEQFDEIDRLTDQYDAQVSDLQGKIAELTGRLASPTPVAEESPSPTPDQTPKAAHTPSPIPEPTSTPEPTPFAGIRLRVRFDAPKGMTALESGGVIYIGGADGALSGMIRLFADGEGQPLDPDTTSPDELTERVIDEIGFADADRPIPSDVKVKGGKGRRFQARYQEGDSEVVSEICVLCGDHAAYLVELEGAADAQASTTAAMDELLKHFAILSDD